MIPAQLRDIIYLIAALATLPLALYTFIWIAQHTWDKPPPKQNVTKVTWTITHNRTNFPYTARITPDHTHHPQQKYFEFKWTATRWAKKTAKQLAHTPPQPEHQQVAKGVEGTNPK